MTVHAGDMLYSHEQMTVTIEGTQYNLPDTAAGQVIATTFQDVAVVDGSLTLFFKDMGGGNAYVALAGLEIVEAGPSIAFVDGFDCGGFNC